MVIIKADSEAKAIRRAAEKKVRGQVIDRNRVSFQRNCGVASVGEKNKIIWNLVLSTELMV